MQETQENSLISRQIDFLHIAPNDNVIIALRDFLAGEIININDNSFSLNQDIPKGHKIAIKNISALEKVLKYGFIIGRAKVDITQGDWVHTHNLKSDLENGAPNFTYTTPKNSAKEIQETQYFNGYLRPDAKCGIRNEIWILPTVGCVSALAQKLANNAKIYGNIDAIIPACHQFGCSQLGEDLEATKTILASLACHPNACGILIIGLGCENNRLAKLLEAIPKEYHYKIKSFEAQKADDEFEYGMAKLDEMIKANANLQRQKLPISKLSIGVKCGGSDGFSGLSANPLIGKISKYFENHGAQIIMTEIPEFFGAEHILYKNCQSQNVYQKLLNMIDNFKEYFTKNRQKIYENPSPGNKDGGISTLEEKSLGAVQKSGDAIICDIINYGQIAQKSGLNILNAPGNDAISSTALAASGAHIVLFSTGRGTPLGFLVPTLKIASNSELAAKKPHWIDFDAGCILNDGDFETASQRLIAQIIAIANGEKTKNEISEIRDFAIWKNGVTL
jgi:altronate hydrolase